MEGPLVEPVTEEYSRFPKDDDGKFGPQVGHTVVVDRADVRVVQGFGGEGDELRILTGHSNGTATIERYTFATGKPIGKVDVTGWAVQPGEEALKVEVEGMDGGRFGVKIGQGAVRELRVVEVNFPAIDIALAVARAK